MFIILAILFKKLQKSLAKGGLSHSNTKSDIPYLKFVGCFADTIYDSFYLI